MQYILLSSTLFILTLPSFSQNQSLNYSPDKPKVTLYFEYAEYYGGYTEQIQKPGSTQIRTVVHPARGGYSLMGFILNDDRTTKISLGENYANFYPFLEKDSAALKMLKRASKSCSQQKLKKAIAIYNSNAGYGGGTCYYTTGDTQSIVTNPPKIGTPLGEEKKGKKVPQQFRSTELPFDNSITPKK